MDINITNYEHFFLLYADDELNETEKLLVEDFIAQHPAQRTELSLLLSARFSADERIVFPDHASLLHPEKERRVIPLFWFRAAAVVLLLLISGVSFMVWNHASTTPKYKAVAARTTDAGSDRKITAPAVAMEKTPALEITERKTAAVRPIVALRKSSSTLPKQMNAQPGKAAPATEDPEAAPVMAMARQLPSLDRQNSRAPDTELVLDADNDQEEKPAQNYRPAEPTKRTAANTGDIENENAVTVFEVGKKNKALSALWNKAARFTRSSENSSVATAAGVRVSLFQLNLK